MKKLLIPVLIIFNILCIKAAGPIIKWHLDLNDVSLGQSATADLDGDGKLDIVFATYLNDGEIYAVHGDNGQVMWHYNVGGCCDAAPIIYDVDGDGMPEVILAGTCVSKLFCFNGATGAIKWSVDTYGSDSPPSIADVNGDGKPEILDGDNNGNITCYNGADGSVLWTNQVDANGLIQTEPALADLNGNGKPDCVVGTNDFLSTNAVYAFDGETGVQIWTQNVTDVLYHGPAIADINGDGKPEVVIASYDGYVRAYKGYTGQLIWTYKLDGSLFIDAPISIGDINNDGHFEIIYFDADTTVALDRNGKLLWKYGSPNYGKSDWGAALADINGDSKLDVIFGTDKGDLIALNGTDGSLIWDLNLAQDIGKNFAIRHAPIIADFDGDGILDIFVVGGRGMSDSTKKQNYGRAYMISTAANGKGPVWKMFRRDNYRDGAVPMGILSVNEEPVNSQNSDFVISPNPASNEISLRLIGNYSNSTQIKIFDLYGNTLFDNIYSSFSVNSQKIDISNFAGGIYFCELISGNKTSVQKFTVIK